jgi:hypothetical protein
VQLQLEYPATPEYASRIAELVLEPARRISKVHLDFSVASLGQVDRIVARMRREVGTRSRLTETLFGFGCYVGEVFVRNHGGQWRSTGETPLEDSSRVPMVIQLGPQQYCDPISQVFTRFEGGSKHSLLQFYRVLVGMEPEEPQTSGGLWSRLLGRRRRE